PRRGRSTRPSRWCPARACCSAATRPNSSASTKTPPAEAGGAGEASSADTRVHTALLPKEREQMNRAVKAVLGTAVAGLAAVSLVACGSVAAQTPAEPAPSTEAPQQSSLSWTAPEGLTGSLTLYAANPQGLNN